MVPIPRSEEASTASSEKKQSLESPKSSQASSAAPPKPYITIRPSRGSVQLHLLEIWRFRDLLLSLISRDLKLRYKQTALGIVWVVLQPLMAAGVFSFVFGSVAKLPSGGLPYFAFSYAGLLGWNLFSNVLTKVSSCLVGNAPIISRVYFPRLVLPLSNLGSVFVDFAVASIMMAALLIFYHIGPTSALLFFPIWTLLLTSASLGIGLVASSLMVSYRDVQYILPVFLQILLYASPVAYSVDAVPLNLRWIYNLNPLTPSLEAMRSSLLGTTFPGALSLITSFTLASILLFVGLVFFKRMERTFADVI